MERYNNTSSSIVTRVGLMCAATFATAIIAATATPAAAQTCDISEGGPPALLCGYVFTDGTSGTPYEYDEGEGVPNVTIVVNDIQGAVVESTTTTTCLDPGSVCGYYDFQYLNPGQYTVCVDGTTDCVPVTIGSDQAGNPVVTPQARNDFQLENGAQQSTEGPGTGTPGYWKNHPEAWPVDSITIGNKPYSKEQAIGFMGKVGNDKSVTIFSSLLSAKLNVAILNPDSCVKDAILAGDAWFVTYVPNGMPGKVAGSSDAWSGSGKGGETHQVLDNYNNGLLLCAHHRD